MKLRISASVSSNGCSCFLTYAVILAGFLSCVLGACAQTPENDPTNIALQSWSFRDSTYWTDDGGYAPVSFTNIANSDLGYGETLVVDTNVSAWLKYNVVESDRTTNLTVANGTVTFWFAPGSWTSTNAGGTGPGEYGRLLEVGSYTPDSSYGLWSIYVDSGGNKLYFSAQTNDMSSNLTTYVCAPISWTTNNFHFVALTYSATNTTLYLDGLQATNGPGVTVYPGPKALTNGFCIGGDTNGIYQAHGLFDLVQTYSYPLDSNDVQTIFAWYYWDFIIDPNNAEYMDSAVTDPFSLSTTTNLAVSPLTFSNNTASLFVVNTTADILYEVQGCTNLAQRNWFTEDFVLGSELTNWTWANFNVSKKGDLFLRIRNWQDTAGTGIPDWWWLQYFGQDTNVNPNADPTGDGWTVAQDFENGWNPTNFVTPPAPQGLTVTYNANNNTATLNWLPSPGLVTGYTVTDSSGNVYNVPSTTNSFQNVVGEYVYSYNLVADYNLGNSPASTVYLYPQQNFALINDSQGHINLAMYNPPANLSYVEIGRASQQNTSGTIKMWPVGSGADYPNDLPNGDFIIPASNFTNNIAVIPQTQAFSFGNYQFSVQTFLSNNLSTPSASWSGNASYEPFVDGRAQLKDNLRFRLRAASPNGPFEVFGAFEPTNYAYAGLYDSIPFFLPLHPFVENSYFRNFLFDANNLLTTNGAYAVFGDTGAVIGMPATGVFYTFPDDTINGQTVQADINVSSTLSWQADFSTFITTNALPSAPPSELTASLSQWILPNSDALALGATSIANSNYYGLSCVSQLAATYASGHFSFTTQATGDSPPTDSSVLYFDSTQPIFQLESYYFARPGIDALPEQGLSPYAERSTIFSTTNTTPVLITSVGSSITLAGYAKLTLQNGYPGYYGYLGQYFSQAYEINTDGSVGTNSTGILSAYGNFFATQPGPVALTTMPDLDTGQQGTSTVYCVSLNVDKNHDGSMDLAWNGPDATSQSSPMEFWANNNYDRWTPDEDDGTNYMDDVLVQGCPATPNTATPDCDYSNMLANGFCYRAIPCTRDLEDYARLWVCGITTNLLTALPAGSTITLSWGDVGNPNSANPTIDLFKAADANGGIGYLTNETVATQQTNAIASPYIGRLAPGGSIQLNASQFADNWAGNYFIWCGVNYGYGGLVLTIADSSGNTLAQTMAYIQIVDIKQMYERYTVGDNSSVAPTNVPCLATEDLPEGAPAFQYPQPQSTSTPYILLVHGWNCATWVKDRFAETAFKRLYWQGYEGRFGEFRWPTTYLNSTGNSIADDAILASIYDPGEYNSWRSSDGLLNLLTTLNATYGNNVYVLAHSMGNVVTGEALRKAAQQGLGQLVNTYVASQAAVPGHCYDSTLSGSDLLGFVGGTLGPTTANIYNNWLATNSAAVGRRIIYYNTNDYALNSIHWQLDEELKPDSTVGLNPPYGYDGSPSDNPPSQDGFYSTSILSPFQHILYLGNANTLQDRYEITAFAAEPRSLALGATPDVHTVTSSLNLATVWPSDPNNYSEHFWHSAEFRGDNAQQQGYWNTLLYSSLVGFNISAP